MTKLKRSKKEKFPKLRLDGYCLMEDPSKCPECDGDILWNVIGWGKYPINYVTGKFSKENHFSGGKAIAYKCPHCFVKCCCYAYLDDDLIEAKGYFYDRWIALESAGL